MSFNSIELNKAIISANTGADAIRKAPIVEQNTGYKCLRIGDVSNNKVYENWGNTKITETIFNQYQLKKDYIMIARTGSTIGVVKYIKEDLDSVYNNGLICIKINKEEFDPQFIYYNLISNSFKNFIYSISGGTSTQPNMKKRHLLQYKIPKYSLDKQKSIANILSTLDKKIELNNQMNKTLEEIAQGIYKSWFVDFEPFQDGEFVESELGLVPEGWEVKKLKDVIDFVKGKTPDDKIKEKKEGYLKYLTLSVLKGKKKVYGKGKNIIEVKEDDILMVMDGSSSGQIFSDKAGILASTLAKIEISNALFSKEFIFLFLKYFEREIMNNTTGSAVPHADKKYIKNLSIPIPKEKEKLMNFNSAIKNLRNKIINNKKENNALKNIKDAILPKLMSGEIRVPLEEESS